MATLRSSLLLSYLLPHLVAASPITLQARAITAPCQAGETTNCIAGTVAAITKTGVVSGQTVIETFFPTTLSEFSAVTTQTTITTTDAAGATVLAIVGPAGVGFLVHLGAGAAAGVVGGDPPSLPTPPQITPTPTPPPATSTSTTSSSEVDTQTVEQEGIYYTPVDVPAPTLVAVPRDVKACNPAGEKDPSFQLSFAEGTIPAFCKTNANKDVGAGSLNEIFSLGSGKELNLTISTLPLGCDVDAGQTRMTERSCSYYLGEALNGCDTNSNTVKHGGVVQNGCLRYSIGSQASDGKLQCTPSDLPNLPGLPGSSSNTITYASQTGMDRDEAVSRIKSFCADVTDKQVTGRDVHPNEFSGLRIYYNPSKSNTQMNISLTYSEQASCPQSGDKAVYRTDLNSCNRLLTRIIDDCNTNFQPPYGKFGGIVNDGCGVFAIQTINVEPIACSAQGVSAPQAITDAAIDQFCSRGYHMDPTKPLDPAQFYQSPPDGSAWDSYVSGGYRVYTELKFDSLPQNTGCQVQKSRFAVDGAECRRRLHTVASKCGAGGKMGAQQQEGCVTWSMQYTKV